MDKRSFHTLINDLKDTNPEQFELLENIQQNFEKEVKPISDTDLRALKTYPIQFVIKEKKPDGEWTTQLHTWAENGVSELLLIDPMLLECKNSYGDTVLMSLLSSALGKFTEKVNYNLIEKILDTDFSYELITKTGKNEINEIKNVLDEQDINGNTVIDWLIDFAYGRGIYEGHYPDEYLIEVLKDFANNMQSDQCELEPEQEEAEDIN